MRAESRRFCWPAPMPNACRSLSQHDRVGRHRSAHHPGELEVVPLVVRWGSRGHDLHDERSVLTEIRRLNEQSAVDGAHVESQHTRRRSAEHPQVLLRPQRRQCFGLVVGGDDDLGEHRSERLRHRRRDRTVDGDDATERTHRITGVGPGVGRRRCPRRRRLRTGLACLTITQAGSEKRWTSRHAASVS